MPTGKMIRLISLPDLRKFQELFSGKGPAETSSGNDHELIIELNRDNSPGIEGFVPERDNSGQIDLSHSNRA
jgi:hypothetical protein